MASGKISTNMFNNGMSIDIDNQLLQNQSYKYSMNGQIIYNKDGTLSWKTKDGNVESVLIQPRGGTDLSKYKLIGDTGGDDLGVLFLVDIVNGNCEIGLFSINKDGSGVYKTLFNDQDDPFGEKLNFLAKNQIEARYLYENPNMIRAYWVDGVDKDSNQPRVFTFAYDETLGPTDSALSYIPKTTSVHAMNSQPEFRMGLIKYKQRIDGELLSGVYQYSYRLQTNDGYLTPWYPATKRIIVSTDEAGANNDTERTFISPGLTTSKGNYIEIKGIDVRFDKIDVAYIYSQTPSNIYEATIFSQVDITGDIMFFEHKANIGEPIENPQETMDSVYTGLRAAKTLNIKDSYLYYGNIREGILADFDIEDILQNMSIKPIFRDMRSDMRTELINSLPLASNSKTSDITKKKQFNGEYETYEIVDDFTNYGGVQIDHLYSGYWRGETYRFGIVFYDKLGFASFAYHLADLVMPEQYDNEYSWTRIKEDNSLVQSGPQYMLERAWLTNNHNEINGDKIMNSEQGSGNRLYSHLRIMGVEVSGIDVSSIKDKISSFKIIRTDLDAKILYQGVITPTATQGGVIYPQPLLTASWYLGNNFQGGQQIPSTGQPPTSFYYAGVIDEDQIDGLYNVKNQWHNFVSPDAELTNIWPTVQNNDQIELVGGCWAMGISEHNSPLGHWYTQTDHLYHKFYYTKNQFHLNSPHPYPSYGAKIKPRSLYLVGDGGEVQLPTGDKYVNRNWIKVVDEPPVFGSGSEWFKKETNLSEDFELSGIHKTNALLFTENIFPNRTIGGNTYYDSLFYRVSSANVARDGRHWPYHGMFIANYVRPLIVPYGGLNTSSLATTIYYSTGHFQPINNSTFNEAAGDIYNGIEVWGGDCWLDYYHNVRHYPDCKNVTPNPGNSYADYSTAWSFPIESKYNHVYRYAVQGRYYANVGTKTARALHNPGSSGYANGLFIEPDIQNYTELYNVNNITRFNELIFFENPKPIEWVDNSNYPVRWRHTKEKFYGDPVDTWRIFQVNDFRDLNGVYGEITSSVFILNQIYSYQLSAFGRLRASDRAMLQDPSIGGLTTGIGNALDGVDYISTEIGNQHQWSLFKSDNNAFWVDVNKAKIFRFGQDGKVPISDVRGLHSWVEYEAPHFYNVDNPVLNKGIKGAYDFENDIAWFSFKRDRSFKADSGTSDIVLVSRARKGNSVGSNIIFRNNATALIDWQFGISPTNGVVIPTKVESGLGENVLLDFYIQNVGLSVNVFENNSATNKTLLFNLLPNESYRIYRNNINDGWSFEKVDAERVSPQMGTLLYNETNNAFTSWSGDNPTHIISHRSTLLSMDDYNDNAAYNTMYVHNMGNLGFIYSKKQTSTIEIIVYEMAGIPKVFDSLRLNCNKYFKNKLIEVSLYTENQFIKLDIPNDDRADYLEDVFRFPMRTRYQKDRMRGKYIKIVLTLDNTIDQDDLLTSIYTYLRPSKRF